MTKVVVPTPEEIIAAAAVIRAGGLVAFPTETVYGLGADALNPQAVARVFAAKGRPSEDPLIVHLAAADEIMRVAAALPPHFELLAKALWPGPLTLIVPRAAAVPPAVSAGRDTVAVRVPDHPVALSLIEVAATPIVAPSANRFGHTSPTSAAHVLSDLDRRIDLVLDGGATSVGVESTVLDLTAAVPTLLRPGGVSLEVLRGLLGEVAVGGRAAAAGEGQLAPGMLDKHYAPESMLWLYIGEASAAREWLRQEAEAHLARGKRVGLLVADEDAAALADPGLDIETLGPAADLVVIAQRLYAGLRALDERRPDIILARDFGEAGLGRAIRDRLRRAAAHIVAP
jgi:L-threonylcarbamoyladenylate synthase